MPTLALMIFLFTFGTMLVAVGLGARFLEAQRKKKVAGILSAAVTAPSRLPHATVLAHRAEGGPEILRKWLARLNLMKKMEGWLRQAGLEWPVQHLLGVMGVTAVCGGLVGWKVRVLATAGLSVPGLAALFATFPLLYVSAKRKKRLAEFEQQFPEALDFMARALRAGHAFTSSLEMLSSESPEPIRSEFRKVYSEQNLGAQLTDALLHLSDRVPLLDLRFFVAAVLMQRESGGNLGEILAKLATVIRERFRLKGQVRAASAHGRITALVLTCMPIGTGLLLVSAAPKYFLPFAQHPMGRRFVTAAVLLQAIGYLIMRKIVNIKV